MIGEYVDRVDQDLSIFKNYMETFVADKVEDIFRLSKDDVKPDNLQIWPESDIKQYGKLADHTKVLSFQTTKESSMEGAFINL